MTKIKAKVENFAISWWPWPGGIIHQSNPFTQNLLNIENRTF